MRKRAGTLSEAAGLQIKAVAQIAAIKRPREFGDVWTDARRAAVSERGRCLVYELMENYLPLDARSRLRVCFLWAKS